MKNENPNGVFKFRASTIPAFSFFVGSACYAMPAQIVIIRHAEKPHVGNELNEKGWDRARALVTFVKNNSEINQFGTPAAIIATKPHRDGSSVRMVQTLEPLSKALNLPIIAQYERNQAKKLAESIEDQAKYTGKTVIICWQSETIPKIAKALGLKKGPKHWDDAYDRAWILRYKDGKVVEFKDIPQKLLPGDSQS